MKYLVEYFLERKTLTNVIIIALFIWGVQTVIKIRKEAFPEVTFNTIIITTIYPGASAKDVEINVTRLIEEEVLEVQGIKEVSSKSNEGISTITVSVDDDYDLSELKTVYGDIDSAVSRIKDLPTSLEGKPIIKMISSSDMPIIEVALSGKIEQEKEFIHYLQGQLLALPGVSSLDTVGLPDDEIHILIDPLKAKQNYIDLKNISYNVQKRNLEGSGGSLESFVGEKKVVIYNKYESIQEILQTNVRMSPDGYGTKLQQIARLEVVPKDEKLKVRNNRKQGVSILVKNKPGADLLRTIDSVVSLLQETKFPADLKYSLFNDQSKITRSRLSLMGGNALMGFGLVFIILFVLFDLRTSFWTAFGIPFSILGVYIIIQQMGISLNALTLGGFVIVLGMLVDDAIVVANEINSLKEKGLSSDAAAVQAVVNVWKPVLASSLTTAIAFSPLLSLGGLAGKFIWVIPLIVVLALIVSLFDGYFLLPVHVSHGKVKRSEKKPFVIKVEKLYRNFLFRIFRLRYPILALFVALFLSAMYIAKNKIRKDSFPQDAAEAITIQLTFPQGYSMNKTETEVAKIEEMIYRLPTGEVEGTSSRIGTLSLNSFTNRGSLEHTAVIFLYLTGFETRDRTALDIVTDLLARFQKQLKPEEVKYFVELKRIGPPLGKEYEIKVSSNKDGLREKKVEEVKAYLKNIEGIRSIEDDRIAGKNELKLSFNHDLLSRTLLTVEDVLLTLRIAFDGSKVSNLVLEDKSYDIRLRLNQKARADSAFLETLPILNRADNMINLKNIVRMQENPAAGEITRYNGKRTTSVYGTIDIKKIDPSRLLQLFQKKFQSTQDVQIILGGEPVESKKIFSGLGAAALSALAGIYLVIVLIFNSFSRPFIVMSAIPFCIIGVMYALYAHNMPISMFAGLAMVGLMGVIVNDSIVMVDTITRESFDGKLRFFTIIKGTVSRLRPILLTSTTTVIGLLPTAYGIGGTDPFFAQMCVALAYGLLFGTGIVLVLVPIFLSLGASLQFRKGRK